MLPTDYIVIFILLTGAMVSVLARKLTAAAGGTGFIVGMFIFLGAGFTGIAMLITFFILGTVATSFGMPEKQQAGLAEQNKGRRTPGQVMANAGVSALLGVLVLIYPSNTETYHIMMAAAIASATSDTLSSEIGNLYGRSFYNILSLKKDTRGLDGVISLEGTIAGIVGCLCIAVVYATGFGVGRAFVLIMIAGTIGNVSDSIMGATLERKRYVNNNAVNFLNTAIAAIASGLLHLLI